MTGILSKKMLVESDRHQTRIAVLEGERLTEVFVERRHERTVVGNVYKGRVNRVLPGMQAAFVDVGLARDAFLYVDDVREDPTSIRNMTIKDMTRENPGEEALAEEESEAEVETSPEDRVEEPEEPSPPIEELLRPGQEILVQVVKDPLASKGARISTHITLPGRYLVLLPTVRHFGVSRKIEDEEERERLRSVLESIQTHPGGLIVRTVGQGKEGADFRSDLEGLIRRWERLVGRAEEASAPALIHRELDLALRSVRDLLSADFAVVWVEGEETHEEIVTFLEDVHPALVERVRLFDQESALFETFGIDREIEAALRSRVWLKSGGYIVINPTEALVAIDVNTGRYVGRRSLEETVVQTNLEAVEEIVRQIRLRDLGGIIVIDFIDMVESENRKRVFAALEQELTRDRAKTKVLNISDFGLVELTRKRTRASLERLLTQACPYCEGKGRIKSVSTVCFQLRREVLRRSKRFTAPEVLVTVHPEIFQALQEEFHAVTEELRQAVAARIVLESDPKLHHEQFQVVELQPE